jgi:hypothetical protein
MIGEKRPNGRDVREEARGVTESDSGSDRRDKGAPRRRRGFVQAGSLVGAPIRRAGEKRGFAVARVLTHWAEIVGPEIAAVTRPVGIGYPRSGGLGATLTLLTTGAQAPMLQMREPALREKVNACYGYAAISRIRFTQTAAEGFAEGQAAFEAAPATRPAPDPRAAEQAARLAETVGDAGLREALARLGGHVLTRTGFSVESSE